MSNIKRGRGRPLSPVTVSLWKLKVGEDVIVKSKSESYAHVLVWRARKRFDREFVCTKVKRGVFKSLVNARGAA